MFKITKLSSLSSGVKRIEAVAGLSALAMVSKAMINLQYLDPQRLNSTLDGGVKEEELAEHLTKYSQQASEEIDEAKQKKKEEIKHCKNIAKEQMTIAFNQSIQAVVKHPDVDAIYRSKNFEHLPLLQIKIKLADAQFVSNIAGDIRGLLPKHIKDPATDDNKTVQIKGLCAHIESSGSSYLFVCKNDFSKDLRNDYINLFTEIMEKSKIACLEQELKGNFALKKVGSCLE